MTHHSPILVHAAGPRHWAELRALADAEDDRQWDSLVSGYRDAERVRRSQAGLAVIAGLRPVARPDSAEARRKADTAVAGLTRDFLEQ